uniref:NADH-ubiquinone oxidoreductase chain 4 n=1 Tax=Proasellus assaforensis TaxID=1282049 RepID=A0A485MEL6_9CRUS|nr:NADH dehydrogenase subunit 4 [Proasellus assaforensis]
MMKILVVTIMLLNINGWAPLFISVSMLLFLVVMSTKHDTEWFTVSSFTMMDSMSVMLILLSVWVVMLMILSSHKINLFNMYSSTFNVMLTLLLLTLVMVFSCSNLMMFYIFFEASLVPTFILILGWGYQPERLQAGVYMMLYTIFASLPLLVVLLNIMTKDSIGFMGEINSTTTGGVVVVVGAFLAFMVKLPLYMVHLWLPKAHVEAPVAGSMILASVLLKLGGYGMIRLLPKLSSSVISISWAFMSWGLVGGVYISVACLRQVDVKILIALSSVAHMAMVFGGIMSMTAWGINGAMLVMLGHGFCSSGLFCIANMNYERSGTRSLLVMKGSQSILPALTLWWFLLVAANMAAPPSMNLLGEVHSILGLVKWSVLSSLPVVGLVFFAAAYSLYLYVSTQHGKAPYISGGATGAQVREHLVMLLHWAPINLLVIKFSILQLFVCLDSLYKMPVCGAGEDLFLGHLEKTP